MRPFEGELLIGGMKLTRLHGELKLEAQQNDAGDWVFAGQIVFPAEECGPLELRRRYRLLLTDGRAGQVVLARLKPMDDAHVLAEFEPVPCGEAC